MFAISKSLGRWPQESDHAARVAWLVLDVGGRRFDTPQPRDEEARRKSACGDLFMLRLFGMAFAAVATFGVGMVATSSDVVKGRGGEKPIADRSADGGIEAVNFASAKEPVRVINSATSN